MNAKRPVCAAPALDKLADVLNHEKIPTDGTQPLASLPSPTGLALRWARRYNLNLIHLPRTSALRAYSPAMEHQP